MMKYIRFFALLLIASLLLLGCTQEPAAQVPDDTSLHLTVTVDRDADFRDFSEEEELGGNFEGSFGYSGLTSVSICIDGEDMPLENAIRDGYVTVEKLIAQAREDARNLKCFEHHDTTLGLTTFWYRYPDEYDIMVRHDVFVASDGAEFLYNTFYVTYPGGGDNISPGFGHFNEDGTHTSYKYEDWNLSFSVKEATTTSLVLDFSQGGRSMQTGTLVLEHFYIVSKDHKLTIPEDLDHKQNLAALEKNRQGRVTLDWTDLYGSLAPGDYELVLYVHDYFDEDAIHPLLQNFTNGQYYRVEFTIPWEW